MITLEICVDSAPDLTAAIAAGADRIELCQALALGGLTPSPGQMRHAATADVAVHAMIRPRAGGFVWTAADIAVMRSDIAAARDAGLAGVVLGASLPDGRLDLATLSRLIDSARGLDLTLHRCFDGTPDLSQALDQAIALGFHRILTSGGAPTAPQGAQALARLMTRAGDRIEILPGAGITADTLPLLQHLPLTQVHASCATTGPDTPFGPGRHTDPAKVAALRRALNALR